MAASRRSGIDPAKARTRFRLEHHQEETVKRTFVKSWFQALVALALIAEAALVHLQ